MAEKERFRFSLSTLLAIIAVSAIAIMAVRTGDWLWARIWFSVVLALHLAAILGAFYRSGSQRAFWIGFALFGWTYLMIANVPEFRIADHQLFGKQIAHHLKEYAPEANSGIVIDTGGSRIAIFSFSQTIQSVSALLFATLGGFVAMWFYCTRARVDSVPG